MPRMIGDQQVIAVQDKTHVNIQLPEIKLTLRGIKDRVDGEKGSRPACPEAVINEIKNRNLADRIPKIKKALDEIAKATGDIYASKNAFYPLGNEKIAALFVDHIDEFVKVAKAASGSTDAPVSAIGWAFEALKDNRVAALFAQNSDAFAEIAKIAGYEVGWAFHALGTEGISSMFRKNPKIASDAFAEAAKASGKGVHGAFHALGNENVAALFAKNPKLVTDAFADIAKAAGKNADRALYSLSRDKVASAFARHTQEFVQIAQATGGSVVSDAFDATQYIGFDSVSQVAFSEIPVAGKARIFSSKRLFSDTLDESQRARLLGQIFDEEKAMLPLFRKFGVKPAGILGFLGKGPNIGEPPEVKAMESAIASKIREVSDKLNLDPNFFAATIFQEGLAEPKTFGLAIGKEKFEIDSSDDIGMDSFLHDLPILVKKGYVRELKENEDYVKTGDMNQMGIESAMLKDYSVLIEAFGAMLALRRDYFMDYCKSRGLKPSQDQVMMGTYFFFNASDPVKTIENIGFQHLTDRYSGKSGFKDINDPRYNALRVYVTALYLQESGII